MHKMDGLNIELTRGDTLSLRLMTEGSRLPKQTKLLFSIRKSPRSRDACVERLLPIENGCCLVTLSSSDTNLQPGTYFWDARLLVDQGDGTNIVKTPMDYAVFQILEVIGDV